MLLLVDLIPREEIKHSHIGSTTPEEFFLDDQLNFCKAACFPNMTDTTGPTGPPGGSIIQPLGTIIPYTAIEPFMLTVVPDTKPRTWVRPIAFGSEPRYVMVDNPVYSITGMGFIAPRDMTISDITA